MNTSTTQYHSPLFTCAIEIRIQVSSTKLTNKLHEQQSFIQRIEVQNSQHRHWEGEKCPETVGITKVYIFTNIDLYAVDCLRGPNVHNSWPISLKINTFSLSTLWLSLIFQSLDFPKTLSLRPLIFSCDLRLLFKNQMHIFKINDPPRAFHLDELDTSYWLSCRGFKCFLASGPGRHPSECQGRGTVSTAKVYWSTGVRDLHEKIGGYWNWIFRRRNPGFNSYTDYLMIFYLNKVGSWYGDSNPEKT